MTAVMPWLGLSLLIFVGLGVVFTGIPAAVVLLAAGCFGAVVGAISGAAPVQLLGVLPERLINLLENDLLQAIPLYVLMGTLINRLPLAEALYRCSTAILRGPAAPVVSGLLLGALLGPMNGSVGASRPSQGITAVIATSARGPAELARSRPQSGPKPPAAIAPI